jgi:hypothetical protein
MADMTTRAITDQIAQQAAQRQGFVSPAMVQANTQQGFGRLAGAVGRQGSADMQRQARQFMQLMRTEQNNKFRQDMLDLDKEAFRDAQNTHKLASLGVAASSMMAELAKIEPMSKTDYGETPRQKPLDTTESAKFLEMQEREQEEMLAAQQKVLDAEAASQRIFDIRDMQQMMSPDSALSEEVRRMQPRAVEGLYSHPRSIPHSGITLQNTPPVKGRF